MNSIQPEGPPEEAPAEQQTAAEAPPVHVRRKWIPISTAAWVVGGGLGFGFGSVLATTLALLGVGGFFSDLANAFTEAISFALAGFAAALAQWVLFRTLFRRTKGWLLVNALGWILAGVLASLAYELFLYSSRLTSGDPAELRTYAQIGILASIIAGAAMVGALQWLALRRALPRARAWIPASALAWSLGIGLTLLAGAMVSLREGCFAGMLAFPIAGGLVAAAITGEAFARLAGPTASTDAARAAGGKRWPALALAGAWVVLLIGALWSIWLLRAPYAALAQQKLPEGCPPTCASTSLSGLNLRGAYLREADLSGAKLSKVQLSQANLGDANLRGADLRGARLARADMNGADLSGADLRGADLRDAKLRKAILLGAILDDTTRLDDKWRLAWEIVNQGAEGRNLSGVDLSGANLAQARLAGADLSSAGLGSANLRGADLQGANLHGADLNFAELQGADLTGANLEGVELTFPKLDSTTRIDPKWRLAWEIDTTGLPGADLAGIDLSGANLHGGKLEGANLSGANLSDAVLFHTYLSKANLSKANLRRADLYDALLMDADLSGADLSGAVLNSADLTGAILEGTVLTGARYSKTTIWPVGFVPPEDAIKMVEPCYNDDEGKQHCYYG